jgi:hypothetical protein
MSNQVAEHMYGGIMRSCPLFRGLGTPMINKICRLVVPSSCMKGQVSSAPSALVGANDAKVH